jgi:sugar phosphate isomerase/epimerase
MMRADVLSRRRFLGQTVGAAALASVLPSAIDAATQAFAGNTTIKAGYAAWQIGCYTRPWAKYDCRTAMDAIVEAGFHDLGLMTIKNKSNLVISVNSTLEEAARVGDEAKQRRLKISSVYGGGISMRNRQAAAADLRHLVDLCAAAGAKTLLLGGFGTRQQYDVYCPAIADCCDYAAEKRVGLTIKPHGGLNATGPQLREIIKTVNHKNFRVWYDAGNILYYSDAKIKPVEDAAAVDGLVTGWCVKDYRFPRQVDLTPGTGQVDFRAVLARLKQGGFTGGPLVIETLSLGDLPHLLTEAKKARRFVESLIAG